MKNVYIAGGMTGHPDPFAHFDIMATRLRELGYRPVNPADISRHYNLDVENITEPNRRAILLADLAALEACDAVILIRGWEESLGAQTEIAYAKYCRIPVHQSLDQLEGAA